MLINYVNSNRQLLPAFDILSFLSIYTLIKLFGNPLRVLDRVNIMYKK